MQTLDIVLNKTYTVHEKFIFTYTDFDIEVIRLVQLNPGEIKLQLEIGRANNPGFQPEGHIHTSFNPIS